MQYTTTTSLIIFKVLCLGAHGSNATRYSVELKDRTSLNNVNITDKDGQFTIDEGTTFCGTYSITHLKLSSDGKRFRITCNKMDTNLSNKKDIENKFYINQTTESGKNFMDWVAEGVKNKTFSTGVGCSLITKYSDTNSLLPMHMCKVGTFRTINISTMMLNFKQNGTLKNLKVGLIKPGKLMQCFDHLGPDEAEIVEISEPVYDEAKSYFKLKIKSGKNYFWRQIYPFQSNETTAHVSRFLKAVYAYDSTVFAQEMKNSWHGRMLCSVLDLEIGKQFYAKFKY